MNPKVTIFLLMSGIPRTNLAYESLGISVNTDKFEFHEDKGKSIYEITGIPVDVKRIHEDLLHNFVMRAHTDFICIIEPNTLLEPNFLQQLIYYAENILSAGVVSIVEDMTDAILTPALTIDDEFITVIGTPQIKDVYFFNAELLSGFGDSVPFTLEGLVATSQAKGNINFCVTDSFLIKI